MRISNHIYDFVFVVLVYRNTDDLLDFFLHFNIPNSKVIVVNSYYDDDTENEFHRIARDNSADFLFRPNNGYGAGNNEGIEYAILHYNFKYLIISNADILIKNLKITNLSTTAITAPKIIAKSGKNQNPHTPYYSIFLEKLKKRAFDKDNRVLLKIALGLNSIKRRLFRMEFYIFNRDKIYAPHGAFIIIPYFVLKQLYPLFNPKMFLFAEEDHLAMKAHRNNIKCQYNPNVVVLHKEDGSVASLPSGSHYQITKNSYLEYFQTWYGK